MPELGFEPGLQSLGDVSEKSKSQKKKMYLIWQFTNLMNGV